MDFAEAPRHAFGNNLLHNSVRQKAFSPSKGEGKKESHRRFLAASRAAALIQLVLVCASYEGRSRGPKDTAPRVTGRSHEGDAS